MAGCQSSLAFDLSSLAGLGLASASLTAYRDLTLGVKSTFFCELAGTGIDVTCFGVAAWVVVAFLRGDLRIDLRLAIIGILEEPASLASGAKLLVDSERTRPTLDGDVVV